MLENRAPHMVDNDFTPLSALDIFVKDLVRLIPINTDVIFNRLSQSFLICETEFMYYSQGIVSRECSSRRVPLHIATVALQLFLAGENKRVERNLVFCFRH